MAKGKSKVVAALSLTMLIFLSGFVLGNLSVSSKLGLVQDLQNEIYTESLGFEVLFDMAETNLCDESSLADINYHLTDFGERLSYLEEKGDEKEAVKILKNQYNALEIKHFLLINKINNECGNEYTTILYFYGPKSECRTCLTQGLELSNVKSNNHEIMIYSFDYTSGFAPVRNLINTYEIETVPTLVIDGIKYEGYFTESKIYGLIDSN